MIRQEGAVAARPTLAAVARAAGVSASTASLAFSGAGPVSDETRARVLAVAAELGYGGPDPRARSLRRGRSGIVGAVLEDTLSNAFRDPVNIAMLDGIADVTGPADNSLLLLTETEGETSRLLDAPLDAVVLFGCSTRLDESVAVVRRRGIPIVSIEAQPLEGVLDIGEDNVGASRLLAQHLHDLGHRRVAVVALELGPTRWLGPITDERVAAGTAFTSLERLRGARLVYPGVGGVVTTGSATSEGARAGRLLLDVPAAERPTAIIAQSDLLASGVIAAADELGLSVPGDLSVVGYDGVRLDDPRAANLTTVVQPAVEKGRAAGRAVLALLAGEPVESTTFTSVFRAGATTGPPRV
ncbi:DNA-binding LacI/PurR family transcriptional regulator [Frigoribacterium sp. PhB160]|uniref:LacI family DNA-binding transcriptional regulator n=1 Tax=Frigoribacterium sp. PhB160 TaxID=2485192 RepID=UPI000F4788E0|nr:LacI family DNA-binding transcriptional regulator [Frigoribacterium sp. PhB160]ROS58149.1 DNA-binding LacI/PurR family transcriptional regulator [Frigoribacterium sp. PhB160]